MTQGTAQTKRKKKNRVCPYCKGQRVWAGRRQGFNVLLTKLGFERYECDNCRRRFIVCKIIK